MKNVIKTTLLMLALVSFVSCKNETKNDKNTSNSETATMAELSFEDENVGKQFQHYIHLKTALVNSDMDEAKTGAKMLLENSDDATLKELLSKISASNDIEKQRALFSDVTEKMTGIVNESINSGEVFQQFCPMAFNNEGGYWLSTEEEIRNPYFGDRMLKCGKVTETIK
ncbi:DUF3347 domain-containing protein [uncultured Dokdonia sp.]|jgi:hypothetical protein|uniref:DUF3347 domain-containing protein n=1 Tax=unclassified Dokdonia TaxID=2615033 RepID=UPI0026293DBF|nr:DUF3347 domain-containing protein [uncultured Dokdonia sp.]|tara:strand:+ start:42729 stop:43238 length:510 start_codon:yes stop_codon:yes gene_type:complete